MRNEKKNKIKTVEMTYGQNGVNQTNRCETIKLIKAYWAEGKNLLQERGVTEIVSEKQGKNVKKRRVKGKSTLTVSQKLTV